MDNSNNNGQKRKPSFAFRIIGPVVGLFIGYLIAPEIPLLGKVPFATALTRGATLSGLDQMILPYAQTASNYMVGGLIGGFIVGFIIDNLIFKK